MAGRVFVSACERVFFVPAFSFGHRRSRHFFFVSPVLRRQKDGMASTSTALVPPTPPEAVRNFRARFIAKCMPENVGTTETDGSELYKTINSGKEIDRTQLINYSWQYSIPQNLRLLVWKLLLGILSENLDIREILERDRKLEAETYFDGLRSWRRNEGARLESEATPTTSDISSMILLSQNRLCDDRTRHQSRCMRVEALVAKVETICRDCWYSTFAISKRLVALIESNFPPKMLLFAVQEIGESLNSLNRNKEKADRLPDFTTSTYAADIEMFLLSGGCALLKSDRAAHLLLDKICTGRNVALLIVTFVSDYMALQVKFDVEAEKRRMTEENECKLVRHVIEKVVQTNNGKYRGVRCDSKFTSALP
ncbi:unnamed protein product [Caenorhabditis auriculariae]|uniref:Uncharacterized protein n=1 Tax=Caenorhabditis auriculariae TaxID=2777116 RepID=A0A8S1HLA1_9PELO|nr:unnamed protein product [Caenorhabditis auriculariae]